MVFPDVVLADCRARVQFIETLPVKCEVFHSTARQHRRRAVWYTGQGRANLVKCVVLITATACRVGT